MAQQGAMKNRVRKPLTQQQITNRKLKNKRKRERRKMRKRLSQAPMPRQVALRSTRMANFKGGTLPASNMERVSMYSLLEGSDCLNFLQATTHPFGSEGVGAVIPDKFDDLALPTYDVHDLEIDLLTLFKNSAGTSIHSAFSGFIAAFLPRCLAGGLMAGRKLYDVSTGAYEGFDQLNLSLNLVDESFNSLLTDSTTSTDNSTFVFTDPYTLLLIPVDENGHGIVKWTTAIGDSAVIGAYLMRLPRTSKLIDNTTQIRIAGAGIKLNPRVAPINTSGIAFAAQMKYATLINLLSADANQVPTASNGPFVAFNKNFIGNRIDVKGIKGATARYNVFSNLDQLTKQEVTVKQGVLSLIAAQTALSLAKDGQRIPAGKPGSKSKPPSMKKVLIEEKVEEEEEEFVISYANQQRRPSYRASETPSEPGLDKLTFHKKKVISDVKTVTSSYIASVVESLQNVDLSKNDLCDPGDDIPVVYYQFNGDTSILLQLRTVVHGVSEPQPDIPFLGQPVTYDPRFNLIKAIAPNPAVFPLVTKGESFKSALTKFNGFFGKVLKGGGHIHAMSQLIEKYLHGI
jgi:hypothetical protein